MPTIWWINYSFEILPKGNSSQAALSMLFTFIGFPPQTPFPTSRQSGPRFCSGIHYFKKVTLSSVSYKFWEVQANGGNTISFNCNLLTTEHVTQFVWMESEGKYVNGAYGKVFSLWKGDTRKSLFLFLRVILCLCVTREQDSKDGSSDTCI